MLVSRIRRGCRSEYMRRKANSTNAVIRNSANKNRLGATTNEVRRVKAKGLVSRACKNIAMINGKTSAAKANSCKQTSSRKTSSPPLKRLTSCPKESSSSSSIRSGLPSPTMSISETSDYQRSTPSPGDERDSGISSTDGWSSEALTPRESVVEEESDPGFSEMTVLKSEGDANASTEASISNAVMKHLREAFEKNANTSHTDGKIPAYSSTSNANFIKMEHHTDGRGQGKITDYMSEMKRFTALRKEKLDRVLRLNSDANSCHESKKDTGISQVRREYGKNDLILFSSTLKEEQEAAKSRFSLCLQPPTSYSSTSFSSYSSTFSSAASTPPPSTPAPDIFCKWDNCTEGFDSYGKLLDHLKATHSTTEFKEGDSIVYKCLWKGCKVYGKSSLKKSWLAKHITSHGGNKPFQCIVDGCKLRFSTQCLLERHVNSHFNNSPKMVSNSNEKCNEQSVQPYPLPSTSAIKVIKRAGKKLKYRRTVFSARIFDLFDLGVMARIREKIVLQEKALRSELGRPVPQSGYIEMTSEIIARKIDPNGEVMVLLRWKPDNILEEEWVPVSEAKGKKKLKFIKVLKRATGNPYEPKVKKRRKT